MKKNIVKIIMLVLILSISLFMLSGCGNKKEETSSTSTSKTTNSENLKGLPVYKNPRRADFKTYEGAVDAKVSYPANWQLVETNKKQPVFLSGDGTDAMANLTSYLSDLTLEDLMEQSKKELQTKMKIQGDIKQEYVNLNGRRACRVDYILENDLQSSNKNATNETSETEVQDFNFTQMVFVENNKCYIVTTAAPVSTYEQVKGTLEDILKSFTK